MERTKVLDDITPHIMWETTFCLSHFELLFNLQPNVLFVIINVFLSLLHKTEGMYLVNMVFVIYPGMCSIHHKEKGTVFDKHFHSPNHSLPFCFFEMFVPILSTTINELKNQSSFVSKNSVTHCHDYMNILEPYKITYILYISSIENSSDSGIPYWYQLLMHNK